MLLLKGEGVQRGQRGGRGQKNSHEFPGNPRSSQDSQKFLGFIGISGNSQKFWLVWSSDWSGRGDQVVGVVGDILVNLVNP